MNKLIPLLLLSSVAWAGFFSGQTTTAGLTINAESVKNLTTKSKRNGAWG